MESIELSIFRHLLRTRPILGRLSPVTPALIFIIQTILCLSGEPEKQAPSAPLIMGETGHWPRGLRRSHGEPGVMRPGLCPCPKPGRGESTHWEERQTLARTRTVRVGGAQGRRDPVCAGVLSGWPVGCVAPAPSLRGTQRAHEREVSRRGRPGTLIHGDRC